MSCIDRKLFLELDDVFFCGMQLCESLLHLTHTLRQSQLKVTDEGGKVSRSHLPLLLPTCQLHRASCLRVIGMVTGLSRTWLAQAASALHTVKETLRTRRVFYAPQGATLPPHHMGTFRWRNCTNHSKLVAIPT